MGFLRGVIPACLAVLVLLCFLSETHACSCLRISPPPLLQEIFCSSDFVIEVIPIKSEIVGDGAVRRYHINTTKVYKTSQEYESLSRKDVIYTGRDSAGCGVYLEEGTKYIIPGNVRGGKISIHLCGFLGMRSDQLTPYQICQLEYGYSQNCNKCKIQHCSNPEECGQQQTDSNTCVFDHGLSSLPCFNKHALCKSVNAGFYSRCQWDDDGGRLGTCLQQVSTE